MSEETTYTPIRTPEDVENLVKQCGGLNGEITAFNFESRRIRSADGSYDWRPVCDRFALRIFMEHLEKTVEIVFDGIVLWQMDSEYVCGAVLKPYCNGIFKLILQTDDPERDKECYFVSYKFAWRFVENPRFLTDSDL